MPATIMNKTITGIYANGAIRFPSPLKLGRKLPLRNGTRMRFNVGFPWESDSILATHGIIRVPKRLARLIAESDEFSVLNS